MSDCLHFICDLDGQTALIEVEMSASFDVGKLRANPQLFQNQTAANEGELPRIDLFSSIRAIRVPSRPDLSFDLYRKDSWSRPWTA